jgi:hypothetical protein
MHPSPTQLERDVFLQAGKGTEGPPREEITNLVEHSAGSNLLDEDNRLLYTAKITYTAPNTSAPDQQPQPCFIGSNDMPALVRSLRLMKFKAPFPIVPWVRRTEYVNVAPGRRQVKRTTNRQARKDRPMRRTLFTNALEHKSTDGYRYQFGSACINIFAEHRLIVYEAYERDLSALMRGHNNLIGGINFIFINPIFSVKAIRLLYAVLKGTDASCYDTPGNMLQRFSQLLTLFLCPTIPMKISLRFSVGDPSEVEQYISIFQKDCRKDWTMKVDEDPEDGITCVFYQTTSFQDSHIRVEYIKYPGEHYYTIVRLSAHHILDGAESQAAELPVIMTSPHTHYDNGQNKIFSWYLQTQRDVDLFNPTP